MSVTTPPRQNRVASLLVVLLVAACAKHTKNVTITTVPPDAEVELNGAAMGKSPVSDTLDFDRVSEYRVVATKEGYEKAVANIAYEPKSMQDYVLELTELTKRLVITSDPSGATVHLDGKEVGTTPLQKELSFVRTPKHLVKVTKDGFKNSGACGIRYEPRDSTEYHFVLEPEVIPLDRRFRHPR